MTNRPSFQSVVRAIYRELGDLLLTGDGYGKCRGTDKLHEFMGAEKPHHCVTLQEEADDSWHLRDGDPICNWCFNTFDKRYSFDTLVTTIARRIRHELTVNQPKLERADQEAWDSRRRKFAEVVEAVISHLPTHIKPMGLQEIRDNGWTHCSFIAKKRRYRVMLTMEGEFNDFWLRGGPKDRSGHDTMRHRWTGKIKPRELATAIAIGLGASQ